ncbi:MAG: hypothetical protein GC152_11810 [Alphaproteobacteria bacterium]|nr:hypothetical protein [Alphaproteobacteria bacterium]
MPVLSGAIEEADARRSAEALPPAGRRAVIDIGSNSVRLVIFDGPLRAPFAIVNEKALCGLGRDQGVDGVLSREASDGAIDTLLRYRRLLDAYGSPPTKAVATAAVRSAANGAAFIKRAREIGIDVEVIDGRREAELAALGVISFEPRATGLIGDMGGGSLELVAVEEGALADPTSLPLGPFSLMRATCGAISQAPALIASAFADAPGVFRQSREILYAVGGAWRAIARLHLRHRDYPLPILHEYSIGRSDILDICSFIAAQSRESLLNIHSVPRRRIDAIPYAALVMAAVVRACGAKRVVVSAGGLREGLIFDELSDADRRQDPLLVGAAFFRSRLSPAPYAGAAAFKAIAPMFDGDPTFDRRVAEAACLMMDAAAYFHPDTRGRHAYDAALRASLYGVSHAERVMLALALFVRHQGRRAELEIGREGILLTEDQRQFAVRLGLAMRFVASLAPKAPQALSKVTILLESDGLIVRVPNSQLPLFQETAQKRLASLAEAFNTDARVDASD